MADEDKQEVTQETSQTTENTEVKLSEVEQRAMEQGWVPQDQWEGDPDQWRPAREFLDRGELFKKIEDQNRTIKEFKKALVDLQSHHAKVRETEYQRALTTLKAQKKAALEEGDADAVIRIDDQIDLVKDEQQKLRQQPQPQTVEEEVNPEFSNWVERNRWYESDKAMKAYADAIGRDLAMQGNSPSEVLKKVEQAVKQEFSHKFRNPNRDKPGAVEGSSTKGGKTEEKFVLTDEERRVMQRFTRTIPGFSEKDYIEELKRVKGGA